MDNDERTPLLHSPESGSGTHGSSINVEVGNLLRRGRSTSNSAVKAKLSWVNLHVSLPGKPPGPLKRLVATARGIGLSGDPPKVILKNGKNLLIMRNAGY